MPNIQELGNNRKSTVHVTQSVTLDESVTVPHGTTVIFDSDVVLTIDVDNVPALICESNTTIIGNGFEIGGTGIGEHQHGIALWTVENVLVEGVGVTGVGGDGVYIGRRNGGDGPCRQVFVSSCLFDGVGRNGVSIVSCDGGLVWFCKTVNPGRGYGNKGVLVEPSDATDPVTGIVIVDSSIADRAHGVHVQMHKGGEVGVDVIRFRGTYTHPDSKGVRSTCAGDRTIEGYVRFTDCDGPWEVDKWAAKYTEVRR